MHLIQKILEFADLHAAEWFWRMVAALATLLVTWMVLRIVRSTLRRTLDRSTSTRTRTLRPLVQGLASVTVFGTGIVLSLEQLGFDLTAVIAGAGVLGLAIGFGSQELIRDVIAGFFLIFDEVLESGDWVEVNSVSGHVEEVGLRMTKVRSFDGKLWYVPNGQIKLVANTNREWMRSVVLVDLAYEQDVGPGLALLAEIGKTWAEENPEHVLEPPEVQGLLGLGPSGLGVRLTVKVTPGEQWAVERELRVRVKAAFDAQGIEIPFGRQVVYLRHDDAKAS